MELKKLSCSFYVSDQLAADDFAELADLGVQAVINNRPDGESDGQPTSLELEAAALQAGLLYRYLPVDSQNVSDAEELAFVEALTALPGPVVAFCRSGTRAAICWAYSELGQQSSQAITDAVTSAGITSDVVERAVRIKQRRHEMGEDNAN